MKNTLLIITLIISTLANAQETTSLTNLFKIDILTLGISTELKVAENHTIVGGVNFGFIYSTRSKENGIKTFYTLLPTFYGEYRIYYNRKERINKGKWKSVYGNSGAYFAPHFRYIGKKLTDNCCFDVTVPSDELGLGFVLGIQRTFASHFQLGINIGSGRSIGPGEGLGDTSRFIFIGNLNFSYAIF